MKGIEIPVPSTLDEQRAIAGAVKLRTEEFNRSIDKIEREISLLREYRTRLIADVVTGKLDVREAAAGLPEVEEAPADEPEDSADELAEA